MEGAVLGVGAGASSGGALLQAASVPRIAAPIARHDHRTMLLILLEALAALALLLLIVWWTMFSGRPRGEPPAASPDARDPEAKRPQQRAPPR